MELEFVKGDVICKVGRSTTQWVVIGSSEGTYVNGIAWRTYHVKELRNGRLVKPVIAWDSEHVEGEYIKVGFWDLKLGLELDDGT